MRAHSPTPSFGMSQRSFRLLEKTRSGRDLPGKRKVCTWEAEIGS
jgi:hypothetical protein